MSLQQQEQEQHSEELPLCEPVTEEERQWMIDDVKQKAKSLQELLLNYRQMEDKLKEEVLELVLRDIHEQNIHLGINRRVQIAQQELLSDTAYIGWAMKNGKGEFSDGTAKNKEHAVNGVTRSSSSLSWKDSVIDAVADGHLHSTNNGQIHQEQQQQLLLPEAEILAASLPLSTLVVPPRVALILGSFREINDADSTVPETLKTRFEAFLTLVEVWKQRVEAHLGGEPCALCLNGIPLFGSNSVKRSLATCAASSLLAASPPYEEGLAQLFDLLLQETNKETNCESIRGIFSMESELSKSSFNAILKQGTNSHEQMATSVAGSTNDTLALVPVKSLRDCLLTYVIVSESPASSSSSCTSIQIAAIEPVVSSFALHLVKGFATVSSVRQSVEAFCQKSVAPLMKAKAIPRRCVLTLALRPQDQGASSILLDVCELTPHLPTSLLSWRDVCSILRQQGQPQHLTSNASNASSASAVFRGQKSRIASLESAIADEKEDDNDDHRGEVQEGGERPSRSAEAAATPSRAGAGATQSVARCFLQIVDEAIKRRAQEDSSALSTGSFARNLPKIGVFVAGTAALFAGAFLAIKKRTSSSSSASCG